MNPSRFNQTSSRSSLAAFFADGGGREQLEVGAEQIREKRSNPYRQDAQVAEPAAVPAPAPSAAPASAEEDEEPAFGEPLFDPSVDGEDQAAPSSSTSQQPTGNANEF